MTPAESAEYTSFRLRIDAAITDAERCASDPAEVLDGILVEATQSTVFLHVKHYCGPRLAALRSKRKLVQAFEAPAHSVR